ncbi:MAG: MurR/RpiR family transcriptional regulator [bacterium]
MEDGGREAAQSLGRPVAWQLDRPAAWPPGRLAAWPPGQPVVPPPNERREAMAWAAPAEAAPEGRGEVLARIHSLRPHLNRAERKAADFVLENADDIMRLTITETARGSGVSEATVLRMCRRLGCRGYQDFKIALARETLPAAGRIDAEIDPDDDAGVVLQKVFGAAVQTLQDTLAGIDRLRFEEALDLIGEAHRILLCGVGTSGPVVQDAHNKFFRLGLPCKAQTDPHLQLMEAALLEEGDLILLVSHSGATKDPVETLRAAKARGAGSIAITQSPLSPLGRLADVVLPTASRETRFRAEALASRIAQTAIVNALSVATALRRPERALALQQRIEDVIVVKQF